MAKVRTAVTATRRRPHQVRERYVGAVKVLVDANVVFDLLLVCEPWYRESVVLFEAIEAKRVTGYVAAHTVTTLWYVCRKAFGAPKARAVVARMLSVLDVATIDADDFRRAITLPTADLEDACQVLAAERVGAAAIVTRNPRHFTDSPIGVVSPAHLVAQLDS